MNPDPNGNVAGGDASGRQAVVVAGLAQFGQRHAGHGGGIRQRRSGDGAEQRRRRQRRDRQTAAES